ncbi:MAG: outer membrane beta-barrel protein [Chitinophagaceae bacterium]|nr:outer membrane beta-barrel protein [Chitinophagaceae bacterium]
MQPIVDNSDPLYQYVGNPDLKQSFRHNVNLNYNFYNVLKEKGMWAGVYGGFTQNAFVNQSIIDNTGKTTSKTVNANGNYNFGLYSDYNFKWKKPNIRISFGPNANISRNITFINGQKAVNTNTNYGFQFGISKQKEKKYDISLNPEVSWVKAKNSISSSASANYWQVGIRGDVEITFLKKFRFETDANFKAKQKNPNFPAKNQYTIWNASLSRFLFKEVLEASVSVNDILNENRGYDRTFNDYRFTETYYNTLKRFWMVTLTWNFSKNGKPASDF